METNCLFKVCMSLSSKPEIPWSFSGESISLTFLLLWNNSNVFYLNACGWSDRMLRGAPCKTRYCFRKVLAICASLFIGTNAASNQENLSSDNRIFWLVFGFVLSVIEPARTNWISSFLGFH